MISNDNISNRWTCLICIGLGLSSCLGFSPFNFFFITLFNFTISIFLLQESKDEKRAFFLGLYFGLGYHLATLYWIAMSFKVAEKGGLFLGFIAVLFLSSFLALLHGICFYLIKYLSKDLKNFSSALSAVFFLSIFDWIKGNIFWGFPWTPLSSIWSFNTFTLYPFSIIGTWGYSMVSFFIVLGIYLLLNKSKLSLFFFMPYLLIIFSILLPLNKKGSRVEEIKVRLVQPNIKQSEKWKLSMIKKNMNKLFDLSLLKGIENIDMVVWPETAVPFDINSDSIFSKVFYKKIENFKSIVFGFIRKERIENKEQLYNSLYFQNSKQDYFLIHDKTKLVPFGEYNPFNRFSGIKKLTSGSTDFQQGEIINTIRITENIFALPLICYEVIFPELPKKEKNHYNLLINITNDGWYGNTTGPYQHLALSRIRAVKEGTVLIRVANTGISAIINPSGEIISKLDLDSEGILDKKIELFVIKTFYKKHGEAFFYLSIFLIGLILVILYFKERQEN